MATKKTSKAAADPAAHTVTLKLTLNDLKKITDDCSSFGGDTWQQIHWGKLEVGVEPAQVRAKTVAAKTAAAKTAAKKTSK